MLAEGLWAEEIGGEHTQLFAEHSAFGVQASIYTLTPRSGLHPLTL